MRKALIPIAVMTVLSGCGKELPPVPEPESRPAKLFTVSVGNAQFERHFPATTEAGDRAVLAFRVPGLLQWIEVNAGQMVNKGDVLAVLNPDEYSLLEKKPVQITPLLTFNTSVRKSFVKNKWSRNKILMQQKPITTRPKPSGIRQKQT